MIRKWAQSAFEVLFCEDALLEYAEKLSEAPWNLSDDLIVDLNDRFATSGVYVPLMVFHVENYPKDMDDTCFILCAVNGGATHLLSYDHHLTDVAETYQNEFRICNAPEFLADFRERDLSV